MTCSLALQMVYQIGMRATKQLQQEESGCSKQTLFTAGWALSRPRWRSALRA